MNMVGLPPGMIMTSSGETLDLEALVKVGGHRLAQRQDADGRRVAVMAVAQRLDRRLDDEIRRAEVGLADAEIDDVAALRHELRGVRQHREGILLADAIERGDSLEHGVSSALFDVLCAAVQPNRPANANRSRLAQWRKTKSPGRCRGSADACCRMVQ